jgi:hypothetical protein
VGGNEHRYAGFQAFLDLIRRDGRAALTAYDDGYKAGQAAQA